MLLKAQYLERYSRGRRGGPAKALVRATGARVQIPLSPPHKKIELNLYLFYLFKFKFFTMAQSVAHCLGKAEVTGSSPVISSNHKPLKNPYKQALSKVFYFLKILLIFHSKKHQVSIWSVVGVKKIAQKKADSPKSGYLPKLF